jgi:hypothetical protein
MIWTITVIIVIASVVLGAAVNIKLNSIARSPQSTIPSGQTLPPARITSTTPIPLGDPFIQHSLTPTSIFGGIQQVFDLGETWWRVLVGVIILIFVLRYVKAMQEVSQ